MYRREIDVYASHSLDTRARRPARAPRARGVARTRSKNTHEKDKKEDQIYNFLFSRAIIHNIQKNSVFIHMNQISPSVFSSVNRALVVIRFL